MVLLFAGTELTQASISCRDTKKKKNEYRFPTDKHSSSDMNTFLLTHPNIGVRFGIMIAAPAQRNSPQWHIVRETWWHADQALQFCRASDDNRTIQQMMCGDHTGFDKFSRDRTIAECILVFRP